MWWGQSIRATLSKGNVIIVRASDYSCSHTIRMLSFPLTTAINEETFILAVGCPLGSFVYTFSHQLLRVFSLHFLLTCHWRDFGVLLGGGGICNYCCDIIIKWYIVIRDLCYNKYLCVRCYKTLRCFDRMHSDGEMEPPFSAMKIDSDGVSVLVCSSSLVVWISGKDCSMQIQHVGFLKASGCLCWKLDLELNALWPKPARRFVWSA